MPGIRRVMADNPGPFTFKGTMSYIVGRGTVAIVDPGPADERHIGALARCRAQRDGDGNLRHPHPSRPFAGGAGGQGGDRRHRLCRRPAPRRAAAAYRRAQSARFQRRPRFHARTSRSKMARSCAATAGPSKRWRRPATPPTTWPLPSRRTTRCSPAIM